MKIRAIASPVCCDVSTPACRLLQEDKIFSKWVMNFNRWSARKRRTLIQFYAHYGTLPCASFDHYGTMSPFLHIKLNDLQSKLFVSKMLVEGLPAIQELSKINMIPLSKFHGLFTISANFQQSYVLRISLSSLLPKRNSVLFWFPAKITWVQSTWSWRDLLNMFETRKQL